MKDNIAYNVTISTVRSEITIFSSFMTLQSFWKIVEFDKQIATAQVPEGFLIIEALKLKLHTPYLMFY